MSEQIDQTTIDDRGITANDGTRKALIERTALTLFVAHGVDGTTTKMIAAAANISEGALYYHYKSKEQLAETLFFAIHERLASSIRDAERLDGSIFDKADTIVRNYCQTADNDWTLFQYHLLYTYRFLPGPSGADNPVQATEDIISGAIEARELNPCNVQLIAAMALGVVLQPALHKVFGRLTSPLSTQSEQLSIGVKAIFNAQHNTQ